ncbi:MAG: sodium:proton antiporter NhaD [Gammaproteobacteria bacterium]|nr:sodium:proton antiporter NhaD [Gammaproteobacteria bacterium]
MCALTKRLTVSLLLWLGISPVVLASEVAAMNLTGTWFGIAAVIIFTLAYGLVIAEEQIHLRKSKPMMVAAGLIWILVALAFASHGDIHTAEKAVRHNILEYAELLLFLLAAMTYINTMEERGVFDALRGWLVSRGFSLRSIFWITGGLAFVISPVADNLTTALLMAAVVMAVAGDNKKFVAVACINIVVAANAGGAFSPFGDITTLMVWQKGLVEFSGFFVLFIPSLVNWLIPAVIMSFAVPKEQPPATEGEVKVKKGGYVVIVLFLGTIAMAVLFHSFLHLPPMLGMMTGLGVLKLYGYFLKLDEHRETRGLGDTTGSFDIAARPQKKPFDIFQQLQRAEWDTLMFFYGVILCVGGLGTLGYLSNVSTLMYAGLGATTANILVGLLSAIVDNIPVMFAVLSMNPEMSTGQWLLVTLTAGVGGSLLSVGSAAGVALMGQARGIYTFFAHLKWSWAIALGYAASIWVHFLVNGAVM